MRHHRRRRLRGRRDPLPHGIRRPRLRHRRGRGRRTGAPARSARQTSADHTPPIAVPNTEGDGRDRPGNRRRDRAGQREREPRDRHPDPEGRAASHQPGLVARAARPLGAAPALPRHQPAGCRVRLRRPGRHPRRRRAQARHRRGDDDLAGLLAGRLRPLRPALHPDELARRRHLPHLGRPRRRRRRPAAVRAAQQLARQRQPRQGPPHPVAGQAEVRPVRLVGRPARARRQRRARGHGLHHLRVRLRPRGRLGAGRGLLGLRGRLARRRALQRRPRAGEPARRRADGPDLRQPRGPQRRARPGQGGARHPRHVRAGWR